MIHLLVVNGWVSRSGVAEISDPIKEDHWILIKMTALVIHRLVVIQPDVQVEICYNSNTKYI